MAKILSTKITYERPGVIRVAVQIQTHRDAYVHNMVYDSVDSLESRMDIDLAELVTQAQLCADLQDELDKNEYKQAKQDGTITISPFDRRVFVEPVNLSQGRSQHEIQLSLRDKVEDTDPSSAMFLQHDAYVTTSVSNVQSVADIKKHHAAHCAKHDNHLERIKKFKNQVKKFHGE